MSLQNHEIDENMGAGISAGVEDAFNAYYHAYRSVFFLYTYKLVQDREVAKDIVSDTYATCWELRERFAKMKDIHAYMYVSCRNRAYDYLKYGRGFKNKREVALDPLEEGLLEDGEDGSILNEIIRHEYFLELYNEVNKLPAQRRQVIQLHYMEGYSLEEVAKKMNMSYALVKTVKSQALAQLRSFFKISALIALIIRHIPDPFER